MKLKKVMAIIMAATMVFSAAGCGGSNESAQNDGSGEEVTTKKSISVENSAESASETVSGDYKPEDGANIEVFTIKKEVVGVMQEIIDDFMKEYPQVTITQTAVDDGETIIKTRVASNDMPDVTQVYSSDQTYKEFYDAGYLMDLTNEEFMKNVQQSLLDLTLYKGIQFSLPVTVSTYGIYYRNDLFKKAGIDHAPNTYDEFLEDLKKLKDSGIDRPVAFDFKESAGQITERVLGSLNPDCAQEFQDIADGKLDIKDCKTINAYMQLLDDIKPYATEDALGMDRDSAIQDIVNTKSVMMFNGSWLLSQFLTVDPNIDIGYCAIPSPLLETSQVPVNVDTAWGISTKTKYPEACKAFLNYLAQPEVEKKYYEVDGNINMIKGVTYDKKQLMNVYDKVVNGDSFMTVGNSWPTWDLRGDLAAAAQGYFADGDKDAFLAAVKEYIDYYYNQ